MAITRARSTRNKTMGIKLETSTGVYIAPIAADAAFIAKDPAITYDKTLEKLMAQGSAAPTRSVPGLKTAAVKVGTLMAGSGVEGALPMFATLMLCSGMKLIGGNTLVPLGPTDAGNTATCAMWTDGRYKTASGCAFKWKISAPDAGKPVNVEFDGKGVRKLAPVDATQVYGAAPSVLPPILISAAFTIGGSAICVPGFEIDGGGSVEFRPCINDGFGILAAQYFPDTITMKVAPDAQLLAALDWYAKNASAEEMAFTVTIGSVAGNKFVITAPAIQLTGDPEETDANGLMRDALEFQFNAVEGDDQIQIELVDE